MRNAVGVLIGLIVATTLGVLAGLAAPRVRLAPVVASAAIIAGYAVLLALIVRWAGDCPSCEAVFQGYDYTRREDLRLFLVLGGIFAAGVITVTWVSAGMSVLLCRRRARTPLRR